MEPVESSLTAREYADLQNIVHTDEGEAHKRMSAALTRVNQLLEHYDHWWMFPFVRVSLRLIRKDLLGESV